MTIDRPSDEFVKRLIKYYKNHTDDSCLPIWTGAYGPLRKFLLNEDVEEIHKKFDNIYIDDLWGMDYNQKNSWHLPPYDSCFNRCLSTASNELKFHHESKEKSVEKLEEITGLQFDIPEYPNRPVTKVGNRNIPLRFAVCYYIFHCLNTYLQIIPSSVLEIGAGTGYFPYLFIKKYPSITYNIIDLPVISVIQTYIYATMVGEDSIWFHGEPKTNAALRIYSPVDTDDIEGPIDLALNHNSFPEIPRGVQSKYLKLMEKLFSTDAFFYSVNWEPDRSDQTPVHIACKESKFKNVHRRIFPMESNVHVSSSISFFEEIYKINE